MSEQAEVLCQNCGKPVWVILPFYGCVFCSDCMQSQSYETADAPEFKDRRTPPAGKEPRHE